MTTTSPKTPQQPESPLAFRISFDRLSELKRSALAMVAERRPESSPSRQRPDHELTSPQELIDEIAKYSGNQDDYIRTEMPVQEIVFRVLLARGNKPTPLSDLHYELTERWATPVRPIILSEAALARILDADTYYGFSSVGRGGGK